jgi:hypothetical protein
MKHLFIPAFLLSMAILQGCEKDEPTRTVNENLDLSNKGFLKVINVTPGSPVSNIYLNSTKLSGALVGFGGSFPATSTYAAINPGSASVNIKDTLASSKLNLTAAFNTAAGKYYTVFVYDTLASAKHKVVEDPIAPSADTSARIRLANFIFSSTAIPNVDIYSKRLKANVLNGVAVESITDFFNHPSKILDTFSVRATGTATDLASVAFTPGVKRNYTLVFRGRYQTTSGTLARTLSLFTNY